MKLRTHAKTRILLLSGFLIAAAGSGLAELGETVKFRDTECRTMGNRGRRITSAKGTLSEAVCRREAGLVACQYEPQKGQIGGQKGTARYKISFDQEEITFLRDTQSSAQVYLDHSSGTYLYGKTWFIPEEKIMGSKICSGTFAQ